KTWTWTPPERARPGGGSPPSYRRFTPDSSPALRRFDHVHSIHATVAIPGTRHGRAVGAGVPDLRDRAAHASLRRALAPPPAPVRRHLGVGVGGICHAAGVHLGIHRHAPRGVAVPAPGG